MSDIQTSPQKPVNPPSTSVPVAIPRPAKPLQPVPAGQFHGQQVGSGAPAVLDLRTQATPAPTAKASTPATQPTAAPVSSQTPVAPATPGVTAATAAQGAPPVPGSIIKPTSTITPTAAQTPRKAAVSTATPAISKHPMVKRFPMNPTVASAPTPAPAASEAGIAAAPTALTPQPVSPALQQVLDSAKQSTPALPSATGVPSIMKVGAAVIAIAIMGGLVWVQNSPKLAFRSAANQAGIQASLPTYVPSSYRQAGPAQVAPGQLTLSFQSTNGDDSMKITQRRTNWDSNSLRENYVSRQSDEFVAVQGQGLTIYLYQDRASWVNHGVWYTVSGTSQLSREQVLKVAYGL